MMFGISDLYIIMFTIITIVAGVGPLILHIRYRFCPIICMLISLPLGLIWTAISIEILADYEPTYLFYIDIKRIRWNELHVVFWLILPLVVYLTCLLINFKRNRNNQNMKNNGVDGLRSTLIQQGPEDEISVRGRTNYINIAVYSLRTGFENEAALIGCIILWLVTSWIPYVNIGTTIAILSLPASLSKGKAISPLDIFDQSYKGNLGDLFRALTFKYKRVFWGMILFIVPGIVNYLSYTFVALLILDKGKLESEALTISKKITEGYKLKMFVWYSVFVLIAICPFLLLWHLWFPLGIIFMLSMSSVFIASKAFFYKELTTNRDV